ncbi:hypothetical protein [Microvirga pudoricolor]|uniref:hypothetical protein n=1 Tax=Microvirga pudoricolor TaxID=2778729 RepID=UPI00194E4039|nr:hypothetical protein [Microvirga pudoricolor]MBM6595839.1 hypothetical protein [Microvirga pudoricolor]
MLNRSTPRACIVCGRPYGDPAFTYHAGKAQSGPAYWSDEGLLCTPACVLEHAKRRDDEGRPMTDPAPDPFEGRSR